MFKVKEFTNDMFPVVVSTVSSMKRRKARMEDALENVISDFDEFCVSPRGILGRIELRQIQVSLRSLCDSIVHREFGAEDTLIPAHKDTNYLEIRKRAIVFLFDVLMLAPVAPRADRRLPLTEVQQYQASQRNLRNLESLKQFVLKECIMRFIEQGVLAIPVGLAIVLKRAVALKSSLETVNLDLVRDVKTEITNGQSPSVTSRSSKAVVLNNASQRDSVRMHLVNPFLVICTFNLSMTFSKSILKLNPTDPNNEIFLEIVANLSFGKETTNVQIYGQDMERKYHYLKSTLLIKPATVGTFEIDSLVRIITTDEGYLDSLINYISEEFSNSEDESFQFAVIIPLLQYLLANGRRYQVLQLLGPFVSNPEISEQWGYLLRPLLNYSLRDIENMDCYIAIFSIVINSHVHHKFFDLEFNENVGFLINSLYDQQMLSSQDSFSLYATQGSSHNRVFFSGNLGQDSSLTMLEYLYCILESGLPEMESKHCKSVSTRLFVLLAYYGMDIDYTSKRILKTYIEIMTYLWTHIETHSPSHFETYAIMPLLKIMDSFFASIKVDVKTVDAVDSLLTKITSRSCFSTSMYTRNEVTDEIHEYLISLADDESGDGYCGLSNYILDVTNSPSRYLLSELDVEYQTEQVLCANDPATGYVTNESLLKKFNFVDTSSKDYGTGYESNFNNLLRPKLIQFVTCGYILQKIVSPDEPSGFSDAIKESNALTSILNLRVAPLQICQYLIKYHPNKSFRFRVLKDMVYLLDGKSSLVTIELYKTVRGVLSNESTQGKGIQTMYKLYLCEPKMKANFDSSLKSIVKWRKKNVDDNIDIIISDIFYDMFLNRGMFSLDYLPFLSNMLKATEIKYGPLSRIINCFIVILDTRLTDPPALWDALIRDYLNKLQVSSDNSSDESNLNARDAFLTSIARLFGYAFLRDTETEGYEEFLNGLEPVLSRLLGDKPKYLDIALSYVRPSRFETFLEPLIRTNKVLYDPQEIESESKLEDNAGLKTRVDYTKATLGPALTCTLLDWEVEVMGRPTFKGSAVVSSTASRNSEHSSKLLETQKSSIKNDFDHDVEIKKLIHSYKLNSIECLPIKELCFGDHPAWQNQTLLLMQADPSLYPGNYRTNIFFNESIENWRRFWCRQEKNFNFNLWGGVSLSMRHLQKDNGMNCDLSLAGIIKMPSLSTTLIKSILDDLLLVVEDECKMNNDTIPESSEAFKIHGLISLSCIVSKIKNSEVSVLRRIKAIVDRCLVLAEYCIVENEFAFYWALTDLLFHFTIAADNTKWSEESLKKINEFITFDRTNLSISAISGIWTCMLQSRYLTLHYSGNYVDGNAISYNNVLINIVNKAHSYLNGFTSPRSEERDPITDDVLSNVFHISNLAIRLINNGVFKIANVQNEGVKQCSCCHEVGHNIQTCRLTTGIRVLELIADIPLRTSDISIFVYNIKSSLSTLSRIKKMEGDVTELRSLLIPFGAYERSRSYAVNLAPNAFGITKRLNQEDVLSDINSLMDRIRTNMENPLNVVMIQGIMLLIGHQSGTSWDNSELTVIKQETGNDSELKIKLNELISLLLEILRTVTKTEIIRCSIWALSITVMVYNRLRVIDVEKLHDVVVKEPRNDSKNANVTKSTKDESTKSDAQLLMMELMNVKEMRINTTEGTTATRFNSQSGKSLFRTVLEKWIHYPSRESDIVRALTFTNRLPVVNWSYFFEKTTLNILTNFKDNKIGPIIDYFDFLGTHCRFDFTKKASVPLPCLDVEESSPLVFKNLVVERRNGGTCLDPLVEVPKKNDHIEQFVTSPSLSHLLVLSTNYVINFLNQEKQLTANENVIIILETIISDKVLGTLFILSGFVPLTATKSEKERKHRETDEIKRLTEFDIQISEDILLNIIESLCNLVAVVLTPLYLQSDLTMEFSTKIILRLVEILDMYMRFPSPSEGVPGKVADSVAHIRLFQTTIWDKVNDQLMSLLNGYNNILDDNVVSEESYLMKISKAKISYHLASLAIKNSTPQLASHPSVVAWTVAICVQRSPFSNSAKAMLENSLPQLKNIPDVDLTYPCLRVLTPQLAEYDPIFAAMVSAPLNSQHECLSLLKYAELKQFKVVPMSGSLADENYEVAKSEELHIPILRKAYEPLPKLISANLQKISRTKSIKTSFMF